MSTGIIITKTFFPPTLMTERLKQLTELELRIGQQLHDVMGVLTELDVTSRQQAIGRNLDELKRFITALFSFTVHVGFAFENCYGRIFPGCWPQRALTLTASHPPRRDKYGSS
jgi:hypothetical protein